MISTYLFSSGITSVIPDPCLSDELKNRISQTTRCQNQSLLEMKQLADARAKKNEEFRRAGEEMTAILVKCAEQDNITIKLFMDYLINQAKQLKSVKKELRGLKEKMLKEKSAFKKYKGKQMSCKYKRNGCNRKFDKNNRTNYKRHLKSCPHKE